jgi:hypothetical protein
VTGKSLAQMNYEAYAERRGWRAYDGCPLASWDELAGGIKDGWRDGAAAVAAEVGRRLGEAMAA